MGRTSLISILVAAPFVLVALIGFSKLVDLESFRHSLAAWHLIPTWAHVAITLVIPTSEALLGGLWLVGVRRRHCEIGVVLLMSAFVGNALAHYTLAEIPNCHCMGLIDAYFSFVSDAKYVIAKACAILVVVGAIHLVRSSRGSVNMQEPPS